MLFRSFDLKVNVLNADDKKLVIKGIDAISLTEARFVVRRLDQRALCKRDKSFSFCNEVLQSIKPQ